MSLHNITSYHIKYLTPQHHIMSLSSIRYFTLNRLRKWEGVFTADILCFITLYLDKRISALNVHICVYVCA